MIPREMILSYAVLKKAAVLVNQRGGRLPNQQANLIVPFVDEFVDVVQEVFPLCCIHFEDWTGSDAVNLLARYRDKVCCYNDDIQGTAGVTLAGLISALKISNGKLKDQRILFLGAGSAGIGIADLIVTAMTLEGFSTEQAQAQISMFDVNGLLTPSRKDFFDFQKPYAHPHDPTKDLVKAIKSLKPTAIIGVSTVGKAFNQQVVETDQLKSDRGHRRIALLQNPPTDPTCLKNKASSVNSFYAH